MAIGFLYCNYNQQDQQRPKYLLEILLRQFAKILPALPESVIALYRLYTKYGTMPSLDHIFKVLRAVLKLHTTNFIIIDALDECRPCNKEDTIELISMLFQLQADVGLNLFVTARTGTDVAKQFTQGAVSLKICAAEEDLRSYLSRSVRKLPSFVQDDIELRNDIVNTIVKTSGGMYVASQHTRYIANFRSQVSSCATSA